MARPLADGEFATEHSHTRQCLAVVFEQVSRILAGRAAIGGHASQGERSRWRVPVQGTRGDLPVGAEFSAEAARRRRA